MIRLRQSLRHGGRFQIVVYSHADPRSAGGGCLLRQVRGDPIPSRRGRQHRKTNAVRPQIIKIYVAVTAKKDTSHTGMP